MQTSEHHLACNTQAGQPPGVADPATQPACAHKSVTPRTGDLEIIDYYVAELNCPSYACVDPPNVCNACIENWHCTTCPADAGSGESGSVDLGAVMAFDGLQQSTIPVTPQHLALQWRVDPATQPACPHKRL